MRDLVKRILNSHLVLRILQIFDRRMENLMTEFGMIAQAFVFKKINQVEGDYFEFGLWKGKTFLYAHRMRRFNGFTDMKLRGFDSFEGLPAHEDTADNIWKEGQFTCGEDDFRKIMQKNGVRKDSYELVKGFYSESLTPKLVDGLKGVKAAIIYIDCDLYESTRDVLKFVEKFLVNGTIVCFDDFYNNRGAPDQGEARALNEFLKNNPKLTFIPYFDYSPLGKSFIVRLDGVEALKSDPGQSIPDKI